MRNESKERFTKTRELQRRRLANRSVKIMRKTHATLSRELNSQELRRSDEFAQTIRSIEWRGGDFEIADVTDDERAKIDNDRQWLAGAEEVISEVRSNHFAATTSALPKYTMFEDKMKESVIEELRSDLPRTLTNS